MAEFELGLDMNEVAEVTFTPMEPGNYTVKIVEAEDGRTKEGFPRIRFGYEVTEGAKAGRKMSDWVNLPSPADPKAANKAGMLKGWMRCFGYTARSTFNSADCIGLIGKVQVVIGKPNENGDQFNEVKAYL